MTSWMTLLASGVLGWALLAGSGAQPGTVARTILVAQDGSGDATTIAGGVAMAADGDTVLVRPGTYRERVVVETDIEIRGAGGRDEVVVEAPDDPGHRHDGSPRSVAFTFRGSFGSLRNLTVLGQPDGRGISVEAAAAPEIGNVTIAATGGWTGRTVAIWWSGGSGGVLRDSTVSGVVGMSGAGTAPLIEWNRLRDTCIVVRFDGGSHEDQPRTVLRQNAIAGCPTGVLVRVEAGSVLMEGNDLVLAHGTGVSMAGSRGTIRGNTFHDSETGVAIANPRGAVSVLDNLVLGNAVGVSVFAGGPAIRIEGNDLRDNALALNLAGGDHPVIAGNALCGNAADLQVVPAGHDAPSLDGNGGCQASGWLPGA